MAPTESLMEHKNSREGGDITYQDMVEEKTNLGESQIRKLFRGSTIFLTGGTGFLGKLMLEKILRCCPDLNKIYVLARPKKDKPILQRLQEQFDDALYDKLRKEQPNFAQKVGIIEGDIGEQNLGIKDEDRERLASEVDIIIHGAATVRFDEAIKTAVRINVRGTKEVLLLARNCAKLKSMVHISTAYSNCNHSYIDEVFYEPSMEGDSLINIVESINENTLNEITSKLLGEYPNTYAFTKSAAENIVKKYSTGLPVAIFRPAIVIGTLNEPLSGWIDNVYGPTGVVCGAAVGLIHALNANENNVADLVPGDMVVNGILATVWKTAKDYQNKEQPDKDTPTIYNYVSSEEKPLTWKAFMSYNEQHGLKIPSNHAIYYYVFCLITSPLLFKIYCFFTHWIPAYLADGIAFLIGKKPVLRKAYTKIDKFSAVISYFSLREWKFSNKNVQNLFTELKEADKQIFNFNIGSLDWDNYFESYIRGLRIYLLNDPMDSLPKALRRHTILKYVHYSLLSLLTYVLFRFTWFLVKTIFGF